MANYIEKEELFQHFLAAKNGQKDQFVADCYLLIDRILKGHRFREYPYHLKQDFRQEAAVKCLRALKNFDETKSHNVFGFLTCTIQRSILDQLRKYYRQINNRKKFLKDMLGSADEEVCRALLKKLEELEWDDVKK